MGISYKKFEHPKLGITVVGEVIYSNFTETSLRTPFGQEEAPTWIVKPATEKEYLECCRLSELRAKELVATAQPA